MNSETALAEGFFSRTLIDSGTRIAPVTKKALIRLNRNEAALELDSDKKSEILDEIERIEWKNYPPPYYSDLEDLIGVYSGVDGSQIVPAAGSANLITALLNYAAINSHQIVIARPSFSLYEFHCNTYGISYETWWLNSQLEYDITTLPDLKPFSMVLFASPNNPVGNLINKELMVQLLEKYPQTYFIVDEVYHEFSGVNLASLINDFPNLILLRSFSKSFSAAGLRIGYLIATEQVAAQIRKLILPFSLNYLSMIYIRKVLSDRNVLEQNRKNIDYIIHEKNRIEKELHELDPYGERYRIKPSYGNFILIYFKSEELHRTIGRMLQSASIELLDVSNVPLLKNAFRMTIGREDENNAVLEVFQRFIFN